LLVQSDKTGNWWEFGNLKYWAYLYTETSQNINEHGCHYGGSMNIALANVRKSNYIDIYIDIYR